MTFSIGTGMGWMSPMEPLLTSSDPPIGSEPLTVDMIGWLGSINYVGSLIGTLFWGPAADWLGRKRACSLVALPYFLSWLMVLLANSTTWLLLARVMIGIGNSGSLVIVPIYISEIAQDNLRGLLGSFYSISACCGVLFVYVIGTYFRYHGLAISCLTVPIIYLLSFVWLPETPLFLWKNGLIDQAEESLMWYRGGDVEETRTVLSRYKSIPTSRQDSKKPSLKSLFETKGRRKALLLGVMLMVGIQASGMFPIVNFAVSIFEMCGTSISPYSSAIVLGLMQLISGIFCSVLVDRLGRRILVIVSLIIMSIVLALLALYLYCFTTPPDNYFLALTPIVLLSLHVVAMSGGLGAVAMIIAGEIFPPEIRGLGMSQLSLVLAVSSFTVLKLFPTLKDLLQPYGVFLSFSVSCFFLCIFFWYNLPETKNIPPSVILKMLNGEEVSKEETADEAEPLQAVNTKRAPIVRQEIV